MDILFIPNKLQNFNNTKFITWHSKNREDIEGLKQTNPISWLSLSLSIALSLSRSPSLLHSFLPPISSSLCFFLQSVNMYDKETKTKRKYSTETSYNKSLCYLYPFILSIPPQRNNNSLSIFSIGKTLRRLRKIKGSILHSRPREKKTT